MAGREIDQRPIVDPGLEWEADHSGVIHLRKNRSETQILEGYGTENFGVSPFEPKRRFSAGNVLLAGLFATGGILAWKYGRALGDYALLWRESVREAG